VASRPGWSRRAQYGLFFSLIGVIAGVIIGGFLLATSILAPQAFASIRGAALDITGPISAGLSEVTATASGVVGGADNYWDAANQNGKLKRERKAMLQRMVEAKAINLENVELKAMLRLREHSPDIIATGRIVGSSLSSPRRFAILSSGSRDGVHEGMPVRSASGIVGRIVDAGALSSRVLLISDRTSIVPARLLRNGIPVISQGRGDGTVEVRPLEVGRNPFKIGDIIISSGTGGLYPPLVPVARVMRLKDDGAIALPLADPSDTSFAIVQAPYMAAAAATPEPEAVVP
jgi:rod shape-determining protein MreC